MTRSTSGASPLTRLALVALATPVHLATVAVAVVGVVLLWPGTTLWQKLLGGFCVLLAWVLRPAFPGAEQGPGTLDPRRAPETFTLLREVATAAGTTPPTDCAVSSDLRADAALTGLRGRSVSVPALLWVGLTGAERIALLGHQLGHFAGGGGEARYVSGAQQTLARWYDMLAPYRPNLNVRPKDQLLFAGDSAIAGNAGAGLLGDVISVVLWPARAAVAGYARLVERLVAPARRGNALTADAAAARAAGTEAATALLEALLALPAIEVAANRAAVTRGDVAAAVTARMSALDAGQRRALRGGAEAEEGDDRHPSVAERLRHLEGDERRLPAVVVDRARWQRIDAEWSTAVAQQLRRAVDDLRYAR